jgi:hypothetical protein
LDAPSIAALNSAAPGGGLVDTNGAFSIADDGVTSAKIADGTIVGDDIADHSIPATKLAAGTALFVVPSGVDFCPGLTAGSVVIAATCLSTPVAGTSCASLLPLPSGCVCGVVGGTNSEAICTFPFIGQAH